MSAFQLIKPSMIENTQTKIYSVDGEQRNRGIEVSFLVSQQKVLVGLVALHS